MSVKSTERRIWLEKISSTIFTERNQLFQSVFKTELDFVDSMDFVHISTLQN